MKWFLLLFTISALGTYAWLSGSIGNIFAETTTYINTQLGVRQQLLYGPITGGYEPDEAALLAFQAGADMILMAARPNDTIPAIKRFQTALQDEEITEQQLDQSLERILRMKQIYAH